VIYHTIIASALTLSYVSTMPEYRRAVSPGGTFFFTIVTHQRRRFLCESDARQSLRTAIEQCRTRHPFELEAIVLLPDHFHPMIRLPEEDADFSVRLASIKAQFTRGWLGMGGAESAQSVSRTRHGNRGVWQKRFWEHCIADKCDWGEHLNYIHYNPVKHGLVTCPHLWPYSTFQKWVALGVYEPDWMCVCGGRRVAPPTFEGFNEYDME
jgi:putative transposase